MVLMFFALPDVTYILASRLQRWALPQIRKLRTTVSICGFANLISYRKYLRICGEKTEIYGKSAKQ